MWVPTSSVVSAQRVGDGTINIRLGIVLEIADDPSTAGGRILIAYGYDYREGRQIWINGAMPFALGAHTITVPMQISSGGDFGSAFSPGTAIICAVTGTSPVMAKQAPCSASTWSRASRERAPVATTRRS